MAIEKQFDLRPLVRAVEANTKALKDISQQIRKSSESQNQPVIHLAFMAPKDPRPSCWYPEKSGLGQLFTITNLPKVVTCQKCLDLMNRDKTQLNKG